MKILGIGEIVIDKTYILAGEIIEGNKIQAQHVKYSLGGPVLAALKLLKNLGCETRIIGSIGDDHYRQYTEHMIDNYGIKRDLIIDKATKCNTVIINSENGVRTILRDKDQNNKIKEIKLDYILEADIIIFDRHEKEAFDFVLAHKKPETEIILDPSTEYSQKILDMSKNINFPIFPIETLKKISDDLEDSMQKMYSQIGKRFIVTDGGNGAYLYEGKDIIMVPALDIDPLDTNGAGDVFRGGFAYGILQKWNTIKTLEFANLVAGLQCLKVGNLTAIPTKEEIENHM